MTEKDLKKLKWSGALQEIENRDHEIKVLSDQITSLQNKNRELKDQLADRTLKMEKCGSTAEAELVVNKVLSDAQKAADQYLESIKVKESGGKDVEITGVLGVMFDRDALGVCNLDRRVTTNYNAKAEFFNNYYKFDAGYFNDTNENFVVFFIK